MASQPVPLRPRSAVVTTHPAASVHDDVSAVHWVGWSDDLFVRAKREHKFVLLDLEAVWCHWCHVMDQNTYSDPKVAELIASSYIAVKVDQDSRPDISNRYEDYGWPATVVFNADGGEIVKRSGYVPPKPMASMLQAIIDDPTPGPSVRAEAPIEYVRTTALTPELRTELEGKLDSGYDDGEGGWGNVHKFVDWDAVEYCGQSSSRGGPEGERRAHQGRQTLTAGIKLIDPVWGGAYQYSTDGDWVHPHYEKLLNFQAELLRAYSQGYARWHDPEYLQAAGNIRRFMDGFLRSPDGAFYVSQDADLVQGEHSAGYFALDDAGRRRLGVPRVDKHIYARENGWAISGLVAQYAASDNETALHEARQAAAWVIAHRSLDGGGFRHDETDAGGMFLADTLYMGRAFLCLYSATAERDWLLRAAAASDFVAAHFSAPGEDPGFVTAASPPDSAGWQPRPQLDENIAAARFFNLLHRYGGDAEQKKRAEKAMRYLATPAVATLRGLWFAGILTADDELSSEPLHVTVVGHKDDPAARALFTTALAASESYKRLEWWDSREGPLANADVEFPKLKHAAAFVCTGNLCSAALARPRALAEKLSGIAETAPTAPVATPTPPAAPASEPATP